MNGKQKKKHKKRRTSVVKVLIIKLKAWWKSLFNFLMIMKFYFESFAEIYIYDASNLMLLESGA